MDDTSPFQSRNFVLREAFRLAKQCGVDTDRVLQGIAPEQAAIWRAGGMLPANVGIAAVEAVAELSGRPDFGLKLGTQMDDRILAAIAVFLAHCTSLAQVCREVSNYMHVLYSGVRFWAPNDAAAGELRFEVLADVRRSRPHYHNAMLVLPLRIFQQIQGPSFSPERVTFVDAPVASAARYREVFGCDVDFNAPWNAIHVSQADWVRPINIGATPMQASIDALLAQAQPSAGVAGNVLRDRIVEAIVQLQPTGHVSAQRVADMLDMSMRTMQRGLAEEGTSFSDLRREAAERLKKLGGT